MANSFTSIALQATQVNKTHKYLGVITDDTENKDYLAFSSTNVLDPNAKFAVKYARHGLVHIRSAFTNRYWVRSSAEGYWITATATEPVDDESAWNCTLFKMDITGNDNQATFYHVQSKRTVGIPNDNSARTACLSIDPSATEVVPLAIDLETIPVLATYVALKADNGKYFDFATNGFTASDLSVASVMIKTEMDEDGNILIRQKLDGGFYWLFDIDNGALYPLPLLPDFGDIVDMKEKMLLKAFKLKANNLVAFRHVKTGKFIRRGDGKDDTTKPYAKASSLINEAQFEVIGCAYMRTVQVLEFDLDKSRIYDLTPINSDSHVYDNPTDEYQQASMNLSISTTKTSTWNNSVSVGLGVETTFKTGVPFIAEGSIKVSAETSYSHDFGGSSVETHVVGDTYTVRVPPMKRVTGRGMATKGTCDVPYSYTQVDHLPDGSIIRSTLSDGIYTGVNAYNFYHDVHYEDLPEHVKLELAKPSPTTVPA